MGYTTFYKEASANPDRITWKEIFSEFRQKHTKQDLEYALLAGSSLDSATEADMLQKWHKPWVFYPLLKIGLIAVAAVYAAYFGSALVLGHVAVSLWQMSVMIPPLVMPIVLMVFFWELNIPRNLSIYELFGMFFVGGLLSFVVVSALFNVFPSGDFSGTTMAQLRAYARESAFGAAAREEPAKLIAGLLILQYCIKRGKKIYGLTGLVIGAAVGAGFGGFESISYAWSSAGTALVENQLLRGVLALGGHVLYAAPYLTAIALNMKNNKLDLGCFANPTFALTFLGSCALHYAWDRVCYESTIVAYAGFAGIIALLWLQMLYVTRLSLQQAVQKGRYRSGQSAQGQAGPRPAHHSATGRIVLQCVDGPLRGRVWQASTSQCLVAGRDPACEICFPGGAGGISRRHCSIRYTGMCWTVTDLSSSYGTFLSSGKKLVPGIEQVLQSGDVIYLADRQNALSVTIE